MMLKIYPDRRWPAFLRVLADSIVSFWTVVWAYLGWLIYQTVMGLEVIADGIKNTGATFNQWIAAFRAGIPGGIPLLTKFLQDVADGLRHYSGDQLVVAGQNIHDAIIRVAIVLALLVALPPILLVLLPYGGWRWRDMREIGGLDPELSPADERERGPGGRPGGAPVRAPGRRDVETGRPRSVKTRPARAPGAAAASRRVTRLLYRCEPCVEASRPCAART